VRALAMESVAMDRRARVFMIAFRAVVGADDHSLPERVSSCMPISAEFTTCSTVSPQTAPGVCCLCTRSPE
jgi:hypothetical protein